MQYAPSVNSSQGQLLDASQHQMLLEQHLLIRSSSSENFIFLYLDDEPIFLVHRGVKSLGRHCIVKVYSVNYNFKNFTRKFSAILNSQQYSSIHKCILSLTQIWVIMSQKFYCFSQPFRSLKNGNTPVFIFRSL